MDIETVENLAKLSRIELTESEKGKIASDLGAILDYVSELKKAPVGEIKIDESHINVMREDEEPHISSLFTEKILDRAPKKKDGYVVVKQIMEEKKRITNYEL